MKNEKWKVKSEERSEPSEQSDRVALITFIVF